MNTKLEHSEQQPMTAFVGQKLVVLGGSSGMGRETAVEVVAGGGSAVIIGLNQDKVDDTVKTLANEGPAYGIAADLADRTQVERVREQLADEHADATLLVNAAGLFIPKPFLEHDGPLYDSYLELDRAIFFVTQTVSAAWSKEDGVDRSSTSAACGPTRPSGLPPHRRTPLLREACMP